MRGQFGDIQHHIDRDVHGELVLETIGTDDDRCDFYQTQALFGRRRRNRMRLSRRPDGSVVIRWVERPDAGTESRNAFEAIGDAETLVTMETTIPLRGLAALAGWLFEHEARRQSNRAFEQDRMDLEMQGYPARA